MMKRKKEKKLNQTKVQDNASVHLPVKLNQLISFHNYSFVRLQQLLEGIQTKQHLAVVCFSLICCVTLDALNVKEH